MSSRTKPRSLSIVKVSLGRLYKTVRSSLQIRMVLLATISALLIGIVFMTASLYSVRASLLNQVLRQAQADFAAELNRAQGGLDSADISGDEGSYQKLVVNMAANVQNEGAPNMVGVFIWPDDSTARRFVPYQRPQGIAT